MRNGMMLAAVALFLACGRTTAPATASKELARMYVAALEVDSLKNTYGVPDRYPDRALDEIGRPFGLGSVEFKGFLKVMENLPDEKTRFDSMVRVAIDEATIRSINEKDTVNKE